MGNKRNKKLKPYGPGDVIKITLNQFLGQEVYDWLNNQDVVATEILKVLMEHVRNEELKDRKLDVKHVDDNLNENALTNSIEEENKVNNFSDNSSKESVIIEVPKKKRRIKSMVHSVGNGLVQEKKFTNPLLKNKE